MGLAERLAQGPSSRKPPGKIQAILEALNPADREALEGALMNLDISSEFIAGVLTDSGHPVAASTIRVYRRSVNL